MIVSIHAPARGATPRARASCAGAWVSIHAPARGATRRKRYATGAVSVSIHAPARGATFKKRGEFRRTLVSIHAPARGATRVACRSVSVCRTFQSTRPRGARQPMQPRRNRGHDRFNPRAREGRDQSRVGNLFLIQVSIHAPARGATDPLNPKSIVIMFQSTRPRGARLPPAS